MYPPMGFKPIGNVGAIDANLEQLYQWCCDEQVPVTAHCNPSNPAHSSYTDYSSPANWEQVLRRWTMLHLNLGHFGWGGRKQGWPTEIARLTATYEHLYADIGNHALDEIDETLGALGGLFGSPDTATIRERFMFGTDWFMVASHRGYEAFLDRWRDDYRVAFPDDVERFLGGAALSFLGFDDPQNSNRARLRARYEQHSHAVPAWLGAS
jgi:predicted TIM-barrel fold metal-dependent hydrolase